MTWRAVFILDGSMEPQNENPLIRDHLVHPVAEAGEDGITKILDIREKLLANDHCRVNTILYAYVDDYMIAALDFTLRTEDLYINLVFVKPEFRRRGIGLALTRYLLDRYPREKVQWDEVKGANLFLREAFKR
jgi:GNAT superfamily N-acetyltransferase